uniref:BH3-interacting domain death agonist n=2 Tax=Cavia porcellus TaxID=10141 RepID=H0W5F0_CAVPO
VGNGAGTRGELVTDLLVFGFLCSRDNSNFHSELKALGQELPGRPEVDHDDELQTDGNRLSHFHGGRREADSESQEELIQHIASQLALIGDEMEHKIQASVVHQLSTQLRDSSLTPEGRRHCLAATLGEVMQTCPADVEQEKAVLIMTMLLARKVADHTPRLFRVVYDTVVDFINQNLLTYVRDLVRN